MNVQERRKAIRSALAATLAPELVQERGHRIPNTYPFVLESALEQSQKSSALKKTLSQLGFKEELERCDSRKIRAGRGKSRGRKYKTKIGPLLVVSDKCNLLKTGQNLPGVDIVLVKELNAEWLAPGGVPGRCTLFTQKALEVLEKENLFNHGRKNK